MIDEIIFGIHFKIRKDVVDRWCNEYGYKDIEELKNKGNIDVAYRIYCDSYFQRGW